MPNGMTGPFAGAATCAHVDDCTPVDISFSCHSTGRVPARLLTRRRRCCASRLCPTRTFGSRRRRGHPSSAPPTRAR
eukprot:6182647-Pleurochrysis_carterae.AAC.1